MVFSPLKVALGVLWFGALLVMWTHRDQVIAAYTQEREPVDLQLNGSDFALDEALSSPSPYKVQAAPDTGSVPVPFLAQGASSASAPRVVMGGGKGRLHGTVLLGPDPVEGATVRISRVTSAGTVEDSLLTRADGSWERKNLLGGRYRVRAFVPFELGSAEVSVIFMPAGSTQRIPLQVTQPAADTILGLAGPEEILVGQQATIGITVGLRQVDGEGKVVVDPLPGAVVAATIGPPAQLLSANVVGADGQGAAAFLVTCIGPGTASVTADVNGLLGVLTLPPCVMTDEPDPEPVDAG